MTRTETWERMQSEIDKKDAQIQRLETALKAAMAENARLKAEGATEFGKPLPAVRPVRFGAVLPGLARMASGMKLPAGIKPTSSRPDGKSPFADRPGILRMAAAMKLPTATTL